MVHGSGPTNMEVDTLEVVGPGKTRIVSTPTSVLVEWEMRIVSERMAQVIPS